MCKRSLRKECRVCLKKSSNSMSLEETWNITDNKRITFLEAFNACTQLGALPRDELPQCVCAVCCKDLQLCYSFIIKAKETDSRLRKLESRMKSVETFDVADLNIEPDSGLGALPAIAKDPLEESEGEEEYIDASLSLLVKCEEYTSADGETDADDNKPLKDLILAATRRKLEDGPVPIIPTESGTQTEDASDVDDANADLANEETEEGYRDVNIDDDINEIASDLVISPEEQIFPQGRFKCKICERIYFTETGLQAHKELHQPKSLTERKKRTRGPNKKKRSSLPNATEVPDASRVEISEKESGKTGAATNKNEPQGSKLPKPKKMFPCHICNKHMISASKLRYHMVMHTGEKDYLCTICPKAYSTIYALKHHMRAHTGERPYECKFCADRFTRPTTLKSHMRRHTGERPYGCEICGKRFIQHSSMTTHMKLNHMAKTIPCPHCDKKYARQTDLNTHLLSHSGEKPFSCQLCTSRFIRQANLNKHMNQHHLGKAAEEKQTKTEKKSTKRNKGERATSSTVTAPQPVTAHADRNDMISQTQFNLPLLSGAYALQHQQPYASHIFPANADLTAFANDSPLLSNATTSVQLPHNNSAHVEQSMNNVNRWH